MTKAIRNTNDELQYLYNVLNYTMGIHTDYDKRYSPNVDIYHAYEQFLKYGQMASKMASGKRAACASCWSFWNCLALSNQERRQMDLNKNMKSIQPTDPVITLPAYPNQRQYRAKSPDALCAVLP